MRIAKRTAAALRDYLSGDATTESLDELRAVAERLEQATTWSPEVDADLCEAFDVLSAY